MKHALILAGGTGGHVFPALAVAHRLQSQGWRVSWAGTAERLEARVVPAAGFDFYPLKQRGLRGNGLAGWLSAPWRIGRAVAQARALIKKLKPDLVLGFGGYTAGPGGVAARTAGIPLLIHEQNAVPGMTNKLLARIATRSLVGFEAASAALKGEWVGNPVREEIARLADGERDALHQPLHILVIGGSLGAQVLNETVPAAINLGIDVPLRITHQSGKNKAAETQARYNAAPVNAEVTVAEFIDDMAAAYQQADLVICRAGALTVAELACAGVASILVPYPHAVDDHQTKNAEALVKVEGGVLLSQQSLSAERLQQVLKELTAQPEQLLTMGTNARSVANKVSAQQIVRHCENIVNKRVVS